MTTDLPRKRLVMGNWKMHGNLVQNAALLADLRNGLAAMETANAADCDVAVCVPFPYLAQARTALEGSAMSWGAQDLSAQQQGAYTGEVSATMLNDFACRWVLVGHSERRTLHAESDQLVADKAAAALDAGLTPVVCVGEVL